MVVQLDDKSSQPADIPFSALGKRGERKKIDKNAEHKIISGILDVAFELPPLMMPAHTADHWPIQEHENEALTDRIEEVLAMLPKKPRTKSMQILGMIMAPISLAVTAAIIIAPRVKQTQSRLRTLRHESHPPPPTDTGSSRDQGAAATAAEPARSGPVVDHNGNNGNAGAKSVPRSFSIESVPTL